MKNRRGLLLLLAPALLLLPAAGLSLVQNDGASPSFKELRRDLLSQAGAKQPSGGVEVASPEPPPEEDGSETKQQTEKSQAASGAVAAPSNRPQVLIASLTIFVLAVFVGFEVITKVPPTLHTPLMSGSNAISGITLVGAVILAARSLYFSPFVAFLAVILATINVVGGFLVTHRMLSMFKKR